MSKTGLIPAQMALAPIAPGSEEAYLSAIASIPVLTAEEEHQLALQVTQENDLDAARQLILSHLRFVAHIARSYSGYGLPLADLIQEGNIGLMKAVKRFDPQQGVRLVSFAVHWIKAEIHEYVIRNWRIVKIATTKAQRKLFFNLRRKKNHLGWLTNDEVNAVAKDLGVKPETVLQMEGRLAARDMGFDGNPNDDDEISNFAPAHYLEDIRYEPSRLWEQADQDGHHHGHLFDALTNLDGRSQDIIRRRWLDDDKATLQDLADEYGVSAERIRQLEKNAMNKLKSAIEA